MIFLWSVQPFNQATSRRRHESLSHLEPMRLAVVKTQSNSLASHTGWNSAWEPIDGLLNLDNWPLDQCGSIARWSVVQGGATVWGQFKMGREGPLRPESLQQDNEADCSSGLPNQFERVDPLGQN